VCLLHVTPLRYRRALYTSLRNFIAAAGNNKRNARAASHKKATKGEQKVRPRARNYGGGGEILESW